MAATCIAPRNRFVAGFTGAVIGRHEVSPLAATFRDGYRAAEVVDHMIESWGAGQRIPVRYRDV